MPSLDNIDTITITRSQAILVSLGAISFLVLAIAINGSKGVFLEYHGVAIVAGVCVVGIGFVGIKIEMLKGIFLTFYPPMVVSLRFAEGAIVGGKTSQYLRWWHSVLFVLFIIGLYYLTKILSVEKLVPKKRPESENFRNTIFASDGPNVDA